MFTNIFNNNFFIKLYRAWSRNRLAVRMVEEQDEATAEERMDELSNEMEELRARTDEAMEKAEQSEQTANEAQETADRALSKANKNEERMDRMFERSMEK